MSINLENMTILFKVMQPYLIALLKDSPDGFSFEVSASPRGEITFSSKDQKNSHFNILKQKDSRFR